MLGIIAKFLLDDDCCGTCASLNACSQAIHRETLPDLWKKLVLWPSKAYASIPESYWSAQDSQRTVSQDERDIENDILDKWDGLKSSPGAKWTE